CVFGLVRSVNISSFEVMHAHQVLRNGGLVLLPTDVGFGLVASSDAAIERIYALKGRPASKPCVTVANAAILDDVAELPGEAERSWLDRVARRAPIAVINHVRAGSRLLANVSSYVLGQITTSGTIATFINAGALVDALAVLARLDGQLVVGSSANVAFTGNNYDLDEVPASIRDEVDLVIRGPRARYADPRRIATTILDMTRGTFVREGIEFGAIADEWASFQARACA
ncbi:MAG TPA: Sua5/YciO/YrdC/YwlC family protein, partial [Nannocystaceae bacterium]|nr:Sua5/YciO/YrdC/YwlC family protein [Nannocystaceae bacterium]